MLISGTFICFYSNYKKFVETKLIRPTNEECHVQTCAELGVVGKIFATCTINFVEIAEQLVV